MTLRCTVRYYNRQVVDSILEHNRIDTMILLVLFKPSFETRAVTSSRFQIATPCSTLPFVTQGAIIVTRYAQCNAYVSH